MTIDVKNSIVAATILAGAYYEAKRTYEKYSDPDYT